MNGRASDNAQDTPLYRGVINNTRVVVPAINVLHHRRIELHANVRQEEHVLPERGETVPKSDVHAVIYLLSPLWFGCVCRCRECFQYSDRVQDTKHHTDGRKTPSIKNGKARWCQSKGYTK